MAGHLAHQPIDLENFMTIYSINQLMDRVANASPEDVRAIILRILKLRHSESMMVNLTRIIMNDESVPERSSFVQISPKRVVPRKELEKLTRSPMMDFTSALVEAAMSPTGEPLQSRDIMMIAGSTVNRPFFITPEGISKTDKTLAGYILVMAGFERKSVYNKQMRQPVKAWVIKQKGLTLTQRVEQVHSILRTVLAAPAPQSRSLEEFI